MERLTRCVGSANGKPIYAANIDMRKLGSVDKLKDALGHYEDLEEQGKLLKLPCAVGDTVQDNDFGQPRSYTVTGFSFGKIDDVEEIDIDGLQVYYRNRDGSIRCSCAASEIGESVFLAREEAEEALKRAVKNQKERAYDRPNI